MSGPSKASQRRAAKRLSHLTITADEQTADRIRAATQQAGAQINIKPL